jgi:exopolyphosphatase/guanosine-5'-triphosphate,3'-diphosphate pyrophosphatase
VSTVVDSQPVVLAAIDMGTNSFHLVVARGDDQGGFEVLTSEKETVRLGQGSGEMKLLADDAMDRGVDALTRMMAVAASHDAEVVAVATSAVREATNRQVFLDRVKAETGLTVEIISGFEEARLIHLGVLQALPIYERRILLVDIGGGSTEILVGEGESIKAARSMKLGAIRLTERFFPPDITASLRGEALVKKQARGARKCRKYVRSMLAPVAHDLKPLGHEMAIGSSGTITAVARMAAAARGEEPRQDNGLNFTADDLEVLIERLVSASPDERLAIEGLDPKRVDIILGGAVLLAGIVEVFDVTSITVSGYALREGVLFDRLTARIGGGGRLADLRRTNALRLARQLDPDADHAETCARLAVRLFDGTVELHGLGKAERELLEMAALVHNVGLFISHAAHHKHTYYVVRNAEQMTGFTEHELELLALVARYHRKSHPSDKHPEFAQLSDEHKRTVRILAGLLRVAIGLDRAHTGVVGDVVVEAGSGDGAKGLLIRPVALDTDLDLSLECFSAQDRSDLLAEVLDVEVKVTA